MPNVKAGRMRCFHATWGPSNGSSTRHPPVAGRPVYSCQTTPNPHATKMATKNDGAPTQGRDADDATRQRTVPAPCEHQAEDNAQGEGESHGRKGKQHGGGQGLDKGIHHRTPPEEAGLSRPLEYPSAVVGGTQRRELPEKAQVPGAEGQVRRGRRGRPRWLRRLLAARRAPDPALARKSEHQRHASQHAQPLGQLALTRCMISGRSAIQ